MSSLSSRRASLENHWTDRLLSTSQQSINNNLLVRRLSNSRVTDTQPTMILQSSIGRPTVDQQSRSSSKNQLLLKGVTVVYRHSAHSQTSPTPQGYRRKWKTNRNAENNVIGAAVVSAVETEQKFCVFSWKDCCLNGASVDNPAVVWQRRVTVV